MTSPGLAGMASAGGLRDSPDASAVHSPCTAPLMVLLAWLLAYLVLEGRRQRRSQRASSAPLPPGPAGLPLVGSLLALGRDPIRRLRGFAQEYGPVFIVKFGLVKVVVLSEVKIIHEAYVTKGSSFNDRPALIGELTGGGNNLGMVALRLGAFHRHQRIFTSEIMRNTGIGRQQGERFFKESAENICRHLALSGQRPLDSNKALGTFVFHSLASFLFGGDSETINTLLSLRDSPSELLHLNPVLVLASKVLPTFVVDWFMPNKRVLTDAFLAVMRRQRQVHRAGPKPLSSAQSYVDGILSIQHESERHVQQKADKEEEEEEEEEATGKDSLAGRALAALAPDIHYAMLFLDFFTVGSETSLVGLLWTLQLLMLHPHWQTRIQSELDEVVGKGELPSLSHKPLLPVTMAVITEVFRFRPTSALGAPHSVVQDTVLGGYLIPEGSLLLSNIFAANTDPKLWCRPDEFDPGRFLDGKGQFYMPQRMMTFSTGRRSCPGEKWARSLIFLFTTAILQQFSLAFPEGEALPDPSGHPGINYSPNPFKFCAVPR